ncbi:2OG-Fe(II) oxygenase [Fastidiosibacter lacustris]|uniref:2OG-Fe(II) oxygenase n=1 Tax=Fastidiosibacter lacustris TaxID=2056695 RepID=UPI000E348C50|nr:2OG-Fe(II) oxygenase [Fastidiosibacter lacustris]
MELCANNEEVINKQSLQSEGFCVVKNVLKPETCLLLRELYAKDQHYRSTIDMQRYNFARGQYRYFNYPFPEIISRLRRYFYENLVDCANEWSQRLLHEMKFPADFYAFEQSQYEANQAKPTPLVLKYQEGDYNCLHQDVTSEKYFPYQMVFLLSKKDIDFAGGEIILAQQRPRMQTIAHVINIDQGDALILSSKYHPTLGVKGYYKSNFKHGVAKILRGERYSLGIIFHNYVGGDGD